MSWIIENLKDEAILQAQAIQEIRLGEDGILHVFKARILGEQGLQNFFFDVADKEQVDFALCPAKIARKQDQFDMGQTLEACDKGALALNRLTKEAAKISIESEFGIDAVVFLTILVTRFHEPHAAQVFKFAANRVNLLIEEACKLTNKIFLLGVEQERREQLHTGL